MSIANVKVGQALTSGMPKKIFSKSFTKFEWGFAPLLALKVVPYVKRVKIQCSLHPEALLALLHLTKIQTAQTQLTGTPNFLI